MQEDKNTLFQMRFPQKLWYLLNMRTDAILWGGTGRTILLNYRILYQYLKCGHSIFKTTNISSFVRQLNLYGFRKVTSHLQDPLCNSSNPYMHEYVHDYFQFGRPELLSKITRKALTMKRSFKPKITFSGVEKLSSMTPLQKARHALRVALKKAAQDLIAQNSPNNTKYEYEDSPEEDPLEDRCEENVEFDWFPSNTITPNETVNPPEPAPATEIKPENYIEKSESKTMDIPNNETQESSMNFSDTSQQNCDSFPSQFLSMPDLDAEPADSKCVELLAEFNIDNDIDRGIVRKLNDNLGSLNCVLPSISQDQCDDVAMAENNNDVEDYNREWDQMFNDMMINKTNQDCGSELKELYSQISKTIDLLND